MKTYTHTHTHTHTHIHTHTHTKRTLRGWNYVNCLDSVVRRTRSTTDIGKDSMTTDNERCMRMTTLYRNVLPTASSGPSPVSLIFAFVSGVVGSAVIIVSLSRRDVKVKRSEEYDNILEEDKSIS